MAKSLSRALATVAALLVTTAQPALASPRADPPVPDRYLNQSIAWKPCFPNGPPKGLPAGSERLECGSFSAPRNWRNPQEKLDVVIAVSRLRPVTGEPKGSVLTNPGGPGGSGRMLELAFLGAKRSKLLDNLEIVGIDVRGVGESTNVTCGGVTDSVNYTKEDYRDRRPENLRLILNKAKLIANSCQVYSGELGRYITTEQTVHDLDLLRHLLGREKINWLGYSGGTWLGAYYATYFPHRVGHFVLDSNTDFSADWQQVLGRNLGLSTERRFRVDFGNWAARYQTLYHLGLTSDEVFGTYERLRAQLAERPLVLDDQTTVNGVALDYIVIGAMYRKARFPVLADTLVALRARVEQPGSDMAAGLAEHAAQIRSAIATRGGTLSATDASDATTFSIACNDTSWHGDGDSVIAESQQLSQRDAIRGWSIPFFVAPCVFWNRPQVTLPTPTGVGVPPVLMVQSVRDPATLLEGAQRVHANFANSRLLTVTDEGDHAVYVGGGANPCVDNAVESFLVDGSLSPADFSCSGNPLPDPTAPASQAAAQSFAGTPTEQVGHYRELTGPLPR